MTNLARIIDDLGILKAQIADLKAQEDALKAALADLPLGNHEGHAFRLSITAPEREKLSDELKASIKAVVDDYRASLSPQYRTAHIKLVPTPTFTVRARSGRALAA
jgi:hypothetical protein